MLDIARIIRRSGNGRFDTVHFFARNPDDVLETQKRIPGAVPFSGNFEAVVLQEDPNESFLDGLGHPLDIPPEQLDAGPTHRQQQMLEMRRRLYKAFPFDIINLDIEGYLFRPSDQIPGKLIRALRRLLQWQRNPLREENFTDNISEFTLMFTTKIGPDNLTQDYRQMIKDAIDKNLQQQPSLSDALLARTGYRSATELHDNDFRAFFLIGAPKLIATLLMEEDWYVDPESPVQVFEFERRHKDGTYSMVHLVFDVRRKDPSLDCRAPGSEPPGVLDAYHDVVKGLFQDKEIVVTKALVDDSVLEPSLEDIRQRRHVYYPFEAP